MKGRGSLMKKLILISGTMGFGTAIAFAQNGYNVNMYAVKRLVLNGLPKILTLH